MDEPSQPIGQHAQLAQSVDEPEITHQRRNGTDGHERPWICSGTARCRMTPARRGVSACGAVSLPGQPFHLLFSDSPTKIGCRQRPVRAVEGGTAEQGPENGCYPNRETALMVPIVSSGRSSRLTPPTAAFRRASRSMPPVFASRSRHSSVRTTRRKKCAAVRVHTVEPHASPRFHALLQAFGQASGLPFLINTSFNGVQEPIVCSPRDAIRVFFGSGIDMLVMGQFVVAK